MEALLKLMTEYHHAGNSERETNPEAIAEDREVAEYAVSKAFAKDASAAEALNAAIAGDEALYKTALAYLNGWWEYFGDGGFPEAVKPHLVSGANPAIRPHRKILRYLAVIAMYM